MVFHNYIRSWSWGTGAATHVGRLPRRQPRLPQQVVKYHKCRRMARGGGGRMNLRLEGLAAAKPACAGWGRRVDAEDVHMRRTLLVIPLAALCFSVDGFLSGRLVDFSFLGFYPFLKGTFPSFLIGGVLCFQAWFAAAGAANVAKRTVWFALLIGLGVLGALSEIVAGVVALIWWALHAGEAHAPHAPPDISFAIMSVGPLIVVPLVVIVFTLLNWRVLGTLEQTLEQTLASGTTSSTTSEQPPSPGNPPQSKTMTPRPPVPSRSASNASLTSSSA
jgi:hypothetical protein